MIGTTNKIPNRLEMPAAVLRSRAPRPRPSTPTTVRYSAAPSTARSTPGSPSDACRCLAFRIDWPDQERDEHRGDRQHQRRRREHHGLGPQHGQPGRHGRERRPDHPGGVLAGDEQHAEDADGQLGEEDAAEAARRRVEARAASPASRGGQCATSRTEPATDSPTMNTTAASRENTVERRDRSLVHSESTTRAWVTCSAGRAGAARGGGGGAHRSLRRSRAAACRGRGAVVLHGVLGQVHERLLQGRLLRRSARAG